MSLDVISVIISGVCAVGSFISFLLAQNRRSIESRDALKNEVISFIACNAPVKTARIADHINLSKDETFDLLHEMTFVDQTISCAGRCAKERIDNVFWTRRS